MGIVELPVCLVAVRTSPFNTGLNPDTAESSVLGGPPRAPSPRDHRPALAGTCASMA